MKISSINNNQSFGAWSINVKDHLLQEARRMSVDCPKTGYNKIKTIYNKISSLDAISKNHFLILDNDIYGAMATNPYAKSFQKKSKKKDLFTMLDELEKFILKDNSRIEKSIAFSEKLATRLKLRNTKTAISGWQGNSAYLAEQIIKETGMKNFNNQTIKQFDKIISRINKKLNKKNLLVSYSTDGKITEFELTNPDGKAENLFKTKTKRGLFMFKRTVLDCFKDIEKFIDRI